MPYFDSIDHKLNFLKIIRYLLYSATQLDSFRLMNLRQFNNTE